MLRTSPSAKSDWLLTASFDSATPRVSWVRIGAHQLSLALHPHLPEVVLPLEPTLGVIDGLSFPLGPHSHDLHEPLCVAKSDPVSRPAHFLADALPCALVDGHDIGADDAVVGEC